MVRITSPMLLIASLVVAALWVYTFGVATLPLVIGGNTVSRSATLLGVSGGGCCVSEAGGLAGWLVCWLAARGVDADVRIWVLSLPRIHTRSVVCLVVAMVFFRQPPSSSWSYFRRCRRF